MISTSLAISARTRAARSPAILAPIMATRPSLAAIPPPLESKLSYNGVELSIDGSLSSRDIGMPVSSSGLNIRQLPAHPKEAGNGRDSRVSDVVLTGPRVRYEIKAHRL